MASENEETIEATQVPDIESMTAAQLRALAAERGIAIKPVGVSKAAIIAALEANEAPVAKTPKTKEPVRFRFTPPVKGEFFPGIPNRHLTDADLRSVHPDHLNAAVKAGFYARVED